MILAVATLALMFSPSASFPGRLADDPPNAEAPPQGDPLAAARRATGREDWDDAFEEFQAFLDAKPQAPQAPEARFWAGFCLVKMGENEKAVEFLKPFTEALATDKWADDALLQLGNALHGQGLEPDALAAWKLHLEKYPESVWRTEASLNIIDLLFYHATDLAACLSVCERLTNEVRGYERSRSRPAIWEPIASTHSEDITNREAWADRLLIRKPLEASLAAFSRRSATCCWAARKHPWPPSSLWPQTSRTLIRTTATETCSQDDLRTPIEWSYLPPARTAGEIDYTNLSGGPDDAVEELKGDHYAIQPNE